MKFKRVMAVVNKGDTPQRRVLIESIDSIRFYRDEFDVSFTVGDQWIELLEKGEKIAVSPQGKWNTLKGLHSFTKVAKVVEIGVDEEEL